MRYTLFGRTGLRVSELGLGAMTMGGDGGWGADQETSAKMLDRYARAGGNFVDTANIYTGGDSERFLGALLEGRRDEFVLASKYTCAVREGDVNAAYNHRKNLVQSVEASLGKLRTDRLDVLWVHARDQFTPVDEVMRALDDLVRAGEDPLRRRLGLARLGDRAGQHPCGAAGLDVVQPAHSCGTACWNALPNANSCRRHGPSTWRSWRGRPSRPENSPGSTGGASPAYWGPARRTGARRP